LTDILGQSHDRLRKSCVNYLKLEEVLISNFPFLLRMPQEFVDDKAISRFQGQLPFILYSTTSWFLHAEKAESLRVPQTDLIQQFGFTPGSDFQAWLKIFHKLENSNAKRPELGLTLLHVASSSDLLSVAQVLLQTNTVSVKLEDDAGNRALHYAACWGHTELAKTLLDAGADAGAKNKSKGTALERSAGNGHQDTLKLLLSRGANINESTGESGNALQAAAQKGNKTIVHILLSCGADVNAQGGQYGNALQAAAFSRNEAVVRLLEKRAIKQ
jgi:ankyrin repeat protein